MKPQLKKHKSRETPDNAYRDGLLGPEHARGTGKHAFRHMLGSGLLENPEAKLFLQARPPGSLSHLCGFKRTAFPPKDPPANSSSAPRPPHLVVRNSMSLLAFSSASAAASTSSTSCVAWGRFPLLPPKLMLEEVELELSPESGTGDDCSSLRKSKPPGGEEGPAGWAGQGVG